MKKYAKRILSLLLVMITLAGILSVSAFASATGEYENYLVLGDSLPSGYGTKNYEAGLSAGEFVLDGRLIAGSYPEILSKAIGANTSVHSHCGWRIAEFLDAIDPDYAEPKNTYSPYYDTGFFRRALNFVPEDKLAGENEAIQDAIKKANLITVNFGTNDIYSFALTVTVNKFSYLLDHSGILKVQGIEDLIEKFCTLLSLANERQVKGIITEFVSAIEAGFANFRRDFPAAIREIRDLNGTASIVVVGITSPVTIDFNLFGQVIDPYTINDLLVSRVNYFLQHSCPCADEYIFADVTGTEFYGIGVLDTDLLLKLDPNVLPSAIKMVHPTEKGHAYMAQKILDAMRAFTAQPQVTARYSSIIKRNTLNWTPIDGAVKYYIYRADSKDGNYKYLGSSSSDIYYDYLTLFGKTYYYKVCAVMNKSGSIRTPFSDPVSLKAK